MPEEPQTSDSIPPPLKERVLREFRLDRLIPSLTAGLVVSVVVVIVSVSLGTLIFTGELSPYLSTGLGMMLFSGILITGLVSVFSSYSGMVAYPQERVAPILAVIAAALVGELSGTGPPELVFLTVVAAIAIASLASGVFLTALGVFKLGALIRFIPYPVIGGFLAGTGYLLVRGSVGVMTGMHIDGEHLPLLFEDMVPAKWLAGIAFGLLIVKVTHRYKQSFVLPGLLLGGIASFYIVLTAMGVSPEVARSDGWLLGPFPEGGAWKPISYTAFANADWSALFRQAGNIAAILLIGAISVLLNSGALELIVKRDIDLNRELKVAGAANILIGLGGGTVGFHSLVMSRLVHQLNSNSRLVGMIASVACAAMLFFGFEAMTLFPRAVLGGLLFYLGMHFLIDWVYKAYFRLTRADYFVVVLILGFVAVFGYLHGVVIGIVACVILFLVNYSKVNVVKHALTGELQHSNVDRPARDRRFLQAQGDKLNIFKLQGYLFFGTANGLLEQVRSRLRDDSRRQIHFMILDFKNVTGIDSSSVLSFIRMRQLAEQHGFTLIFSQISTNISRLLDKEGFTQADASVFQIFADVDHGLEWCENHVLEVNHMTAADDGSRLLSDQLKEYLSDEEDFQKLLSYFERMEISEGECLIRQGDPANDLFLIEKGQVTAQLELEDGKALRLRTMCPGAIVGELGMILGEARTATIVSDRTTVAYRLTFENLRRMESEAPSVAVSFHRFITHLVAERLVNTDKTIQVLLD